MIWIMFVLASIFSLVILLNMLIAIMGQSFSRVQQNTESHFLREHLQLIIDNSFLYNRNKMFSEVKYLIAIVDDRDNLKDEYKKNEESREITQFAERIKAL